MHPSSATQTWCHTTLSLIVSALPCGLTRCLPSASSRAIMGSMTRVLPSPMLSWAMGANPSGPEPSSSVLARVCCAGRICRRPSTSNTSHWAWQDTSHVRCVSSSCRQHYSTFQQNVLAAKCST